MSRFRFGSIRLPLPGSIGQRDGVRIGEPRLPTPGKERSDVLHGGTVVQLDVDVRPAAEVLCQRLEHGQFLRRRVGRKLLWRQLQDDAVVVKQQAVRDVRTRARAALIQRHAADQPAIEEGPTTLNCAPVARQSASR